MDIRGKKLVVIGGAGLIGSHTVDQLTREDVGEIVIYDNFTRGSLENLEDALHAHVFFGAGRFGKRAQFQIFQHRQG